MNGYPTVGIRVSCRHDFVVSDTNLVFMPRFWNMTKKVAFQRLIGLLAVVAAVTGCHPAARTYPSNSTFVAGPTVAEFTESSVRVVVALESDEQRRPLLRATFTPLEAGFHLYGKDLPKAGVNGVGRPTRLDVPKQTSIRSAGPSFADAVAKDIMFDVIGATLPVYPEGPVTIHLPVELSPANGGTTVQLAFTYMACQTDGQCRFPVNDKVVEAHIPTIQ
jgi:hypothetical protein